MFSLLGILPSRTGRVEGARSTILSPVECTSSWKRVTYVCQMFVYQTYTYSYTSTLHLIFFLQLFFNSIQIIVMTCEPILLRRCKIPFYTFEMAKVFFTHNKHIHFGQVVNQNHLREPPGRLFSCLKKLNNWNPCHTSERKRGKNAFKAGRQSRSPNGTLMLYYNTAQSLGSIEWNVWPYKTITFNMQSIIQFRNVFGSVQPSLVFLLLPLLIEENALKAVNKCCMFWNARRSVWRRTQEA